MWITPLHLCARRNGEGAAILLIPGVDRAVKGLHADLKQLIGISSSVGRSGRQDSAYIDIESLPLRLRKVSGRCAAGC